MMHSKLMLSSNFFCLKVFLNSVYDKVETNQNVHYSYYNGLQTTVLSQNQAEFKFIW